MYAFGDLRLNRWTLLILALLSTFIIYALVNDPRFYFYDDNQRQHFPYLKDVAYRLIHGHNVLLSLATFNGGNYAMEMQYGIFNPITLLLSLTFNVFKNYLLISAVISTFYVFAAFTGAFLLGRAYHLSDALSFILATFVATNNYFHYVYLAYWLPGAVGFTWFIWSWYSLKTLKLGSYPRFLFCVFAVYLVCNSGWPQAMVAMGCVFLAIFIGLRIQNHKSSQDSRLSWVMALAFFAGISLSLPALLPYILSADSNDRLSILRQGDAIGPLTVGAPSFGNFLNVSNPFFIGDMMFGSRRQPGSLYEIPSFYCAWFILPLLPILLSPMLKICKQHKEIPIILFALICLLLMPPTLFTMRQPARFLPFFHVSILLLAILALKQAPWPQNREAQIKLIAVSVCMLLLAVLPGFFVDPHDVFLQNIGYFLFIYPSIMLLIIAVNCPKYILLAIWLVGICTFSQTHTTFPVPPIRDWEEHAQGYASDHGVLDQTFAGYDLLIENTKYDGIADNKDEIRSAATSIYHGVPSINGYSPVGNKGFGAAFCIDTFTGLDRSPWALKCGKSLRFFAREPITNARYTRLMKVKRIYVQHEYLDWAETARDELTLVHKGRYADEYKNALPDLPGTVSWVSDGLTAEALPDHPLASTDEWVKISNGDKPGRIVWARMAWPGYSLSLNDSPLPISQIGGFLLSAEIPPQAQGLIHVTFTPPGLWLGCVIGIISITLALLGYAYISRQKIKREQPI